MPVQIHTQREEISIKKNLKKQEDQSPYSMKNP